MKAGDIFIATDGNDYYRLVDYDGWFECASCHRETLSGLCGCPTPSPVRSGKAALVAMLEKERPCA